MNSENYLYTMGYTEKSLKEFVDLLRQNNITKLVDIRLKNSSQLAGFAKGEDLKYLLEELLKLKYEHQALLFPTEEIFEKYKKDKNWSEYEVAFNDLIAKRHIEILLPSIFNGKERVCLLCSENYSEKCHRRLVAEHFKKFDNSINIIHLEKQIIETKFYKKDSIKNKGKSKQSLITSIPNSSKIQS